MTSTLVLLAVLTTGTLACGVAPGGQPIGGESSERAILTASIFPPVSWTYSGKPTHGQATSRAQALDRVEKDIDLAIRVLLLSNFFPAEALKLDVDFEPLPRHLLEDGCGSASSTPAAEIEDGHVSVDCSSEDAIPQELILKLSSTMGAAPLKLWEELGIRLTDKLVTKNVEFDSPFEAELDK